MEPSHWLQLSRTVRFGDTDAAGVMHFQRLLGWCHEAYEQSLERFGLAAAEVFPTPGSSLAVALPIVHCQADFLRPLVCGDGLAIALKPRRLDAGRFEVGYSFCCNGDSVARGLTCHVAIETTSRRRCPLPAALNLRLEASSLGGVQPL